MLKSSIFQHACDIVAEKLIKFSDVMRLVTWPVIVQREMAIFVATNATRLDILQMTAVEKKMRVLNATIKLDSL